MSELRQIEWLVQFVYLDTRLILSRGINEYAHGLHRPTPFPCKRKCNASTLTLKPVNIFTTKTRDDSHSRQLQPTRQIKKQILQRFAAIRVFLAIDEKILLSSAYLTKTHTS